MKLQVSKSYILTTLQNTIIKQKVKIAGIITYDEALHVPYNVRTLAINEKVIDPSNEDAEYLKKQIYYKCIVLNPDNTEEELNEYLLVWDAIINSESTTELNRTYGLEMSVDIDPNSNITINEVTDYLKESMTTKFGSNISFNVKISNTVNSIQNNTEAVLNNAKQTEETLKEAMNTLLSIIALKTSIDTTVTKLTEFNLTDDLSTMNTKIDEIAVSVNNIYNKVK